MAAGNVTVLDAPPALGGLFAKAALGAALAPVRGLLPGGSGSGSRKLQDTVYEAPDQKIDQAHLTAYEKVCGFRVSDVLPATYIHIMCFPLQVKYMTDPDFPFQLMGMVHVENSITQLRPVLASEKVSLSVRAADLRPHSAGQVFDFISTGTVDGEVVWRGKSTYLKRGKPAGAASAKPAAAKKAGKHAASEGPTGPASVWRIGEDIGRKYAAVSGDRNPIHLHALTAKAFGFPSAIAHGMWSKARVLAAVESRLPDAYTVSISFKTPILLPSSVQFSATQTDDGWTLDLRNAKNGKPHLTGTIS